MDIFNIIAGTCSILSLLASLIIANKVLKISAVINNMTNSSLSANKGRQKQTGQGNMQAGGDINATRE